MKVTDYNPMTVEPPPGPYMESSTEAQYDPALRRHPDYVDMLLRRTSTWVQAKQEQLDQETADAIAFFKQLREECE